MQILHISNHENKYFWTSSLYILLKYKLYEKKKFDQNIIAEIHFELVTPLLVEVDRTYFQGIYENKWSAVGKSR